MKSKKFSTILMLVSMAVIMFMFLGVVGTATAEDLPIDDPIYASSGNFGASTEVTDSCPMLPGILQWKTAFMNTGASAVNCEVWIWLAKDRTDSSTWTCLKDISSKYPHNYYGFDAAMWTRAGVFTLQPNVAELVWHGIDFIGLDPVCIDIVTVIIDTDVDGQLDVTHILTMEIE